MNNEAKNGMECSEFEALLADALDDSLAADARTAFDEHGKSCEVCGPLFAEAWDGMVMVQGLAELEPPKNLVHNILAATSRKEATAEQIAEEAKLGWMERMRRTLKPQVGGLMHSRFAMSFAMAFFSLSITLTLAGVKITDVKNMVEHPSMLRKNAVLGFTHVEAKVASYYENLRLVYQVQAKVRELKKNTAPVTDTGGENRQQNRKSAPEDGRPKEYENYSMERDGGLIAQTFTWHEGAQI
ncbi:MAG TPA: hypothetical protein VNZ47_03660 [Candidatus Dormibacteraeota bacterium]|nr:hypothetical protein [Candidatus Dormibacteraeota bacterium]